ncbi:hypothetical protein EDB89DRAFT_1952673 [Lactarius sanguifluus]|nr:hypothetical protein EDB89DRAFT_1952673 [Lactarius sanguifluus]
MSDDDKVHKLDDNKDRMSDDKDRKSDDDKSHKLDNYNDRKSDGDKDRKSDYDDKDHQSDYDDRDHQSGDCAVEHQKCCNSVDSIEEARDLGLLSIIPVTVITGGNAHSNCSPNLAGGKACTAQTVCCKNAKFYGQLAVGCTNFNL